MKKCFSVLVLLFGSLSPCLANLGESEAAIAERYGTTFGQIPTNTFGVVTGFVAGGYVVGVKLIDGTSEMEMFCKADQAEMPASEIDRLLKKNSPGDWKAEATGKAHWRRWRREDGSAVALYDAVRHFLYVMSRNFYEIKGQQMEQQAWDFNQRPQVGAGQSGAAEIRPITPAPTVSPSPSASAPP
ncbi:MAG: hypothetical protein ACJ8M1_08125 [Chthoniobacterales bacterium]